LGWWQTDLGDRATVERIERVDGDPIDYAGHAKAEDVVAAIEAAGIEFIGDTGANLVGAKRPR